jgi:hypothetical protein
MRATRYFNKQEPILPESANKLEPVVWDKLLEKMAKLELTYRTLEVGADAQDSELRRDN